MARGQAWRGGGGGGVGFCRRPRLPAPVLGYGGGARLGGRPRPRPPVVGAADPARRTRRGLCRRRVCPGRQPRPDNPHALPRFRRLLAADRERAGAGRRLRPLAVALRRAYLAGGEDGPRSMAATAWAVRGVKPGP